MNELKCNNCAHNIVCSIKSEFANAQDAVDRVTVPNDDGSWISLKDIKWIKPVTLDCIHFLPPITTQRGYSTNLCGNGYSATGIDRRLERNITYTVTG